MKKFKFLYCQRQGHIYRDLLLDSSICVLYRKILSRKDNPEGIETKNVADWIRLP